MAYMIFLEHNTYRCAVTGLEVDLKTHIDQLRHDPLLSPDFWDKVDSIDMGRAMLARHEYSGWIVNEHDFNDINEVEVQVVPDGHRHYMVSTSYTVEVSTYVIASSDHEAMLIATHNHEISAAASKDKRVLGISGVRTTAYESSARPM